MTTQFLTLIGPPAIAGAISAWLRDAKLPSWLDALIAFLVVFLTALVWQAIGNKLTGNLVIDTMIIAGYAAALIAGPMARLDQYLVVQWPSPFAWITEALSPIPIQEPTPTPRSTVTPRPIPPITLPTTPGLVQRNSMLNGPTWHPATAGPIAPSQPLQVPSVDAVPPTNSAQAATGPLPSVPPQGSNGGQGDQGVPPYGP